jgi:hypothetical protein
VVATDDAQLSVGKSTSDYDWYLPPLLSLSLFSLSLDQKVNPLAIMTGILHSFRCFLFHQKQLEL